MSPSRRSIAGGSGVPRWSMALALLVAACTAGTVPSVPPGVDTTSLLPTVASARPVPSRSAEAGPSGSPAVSPCPRLDGEPIAGRVLAKIPIARPGTVDAPWALGVGAGSVWVANRGGGYGSVMRIDPETNTVVATVELDGKHRGGPGVAYGAAWVGTKTHLVRIDTKSNKAIKVASFGVEHLYAGDEGLWVVEPEAVSRLDPEDGTRLVTIELPGAVWPAETSYGEGSLWVIDPDQEEAWRLDPQRPGVVARIPVGNLPHTIEFTDGAAWVAGPGFERDPSAAGCSAVHRIDTETNEIIATIPVGRQGSATIETFEGSLWTRPESGILARIDPATNRVEEVLRGLPSSGIASDIAGGFGSLWAANWEDGTVWRIDP